MLLVRRAPGPEPAPSPPLERRPFDRGALLAGEPPLALPLAHVLRTARRARRKKPPLRLPEAAALEPREGEDDADDAGVDDGPLEAPAPLPGPLAPRGRAVLLRKAAPAARAEPARKPAPRHPAVVAYASLGGDDAPLPGFRAGDPTMARLPAPVLHLLAHAPDAELGRQEGLLADALGRHYPELRHARQGPAYHDPALVRGLDPLEHAERSVAALRTDDLPAADRHDLRLAALLHGLGAVRGGDDAGRAQFASHLLSPFLRGLPLPAERLRRLHTLVATQDVLPGVASGALHPDQAAARLGDGPTLHLAGRLAEALLAATPGRAGGAPALLEAREAARRAQARPAAEEAPGGPPPRYRAAGRVPPHVADWFAGSPPPASASLVDYAGRRLAMAAAPWTNYVAGAGYHPALRAGGLGPAHRQAVAALRGLDGAGRHAHAQEAVRAALRALNLPHPEASPLAVALADVGRAGQPAGSTDGAWLAAEPGVRAKAAPIVRQHAEWLAHVLTAMAACAAPARGVAAPALWAGA